jgi:hypothetical protein
MSTRRLAATPLAREATMACSAGAVRPVSVMVPVSASGSGCTTRTVFNAASLGGWPAFVVASAVTGEVMDCVHAK